MHGETLKFFDPFYVCEKSISKYCQCELNDRQLCSESCVNEFREKNFRVYYFEVLQKFYD